MTHTEKINKVGEMYTTTSGGITCYDLFTRAGEYRGGKIYNSNKKYIILSGSCKLTQEINNIDITQDIDSNSGIFEIASHTPHIFYFPVDCRMIEWLPEGTQSENFDRYREMKK